MPISPSSSSRDSRDKKWSWERKFASVGFVAGIIWWIAALVIYDSNAPECLSAAAATFLVCYYIHIQITINSKSIDEDGNINIKIQDLFSCVHFLEASLTYVTYIILYSISPNLFHKYWFYVALGWLTYMTYAMIFNWEDIHPKKRLFWTIHHIYTFVIFGMRHVKTSPHEWDDKSIRCCFIYVTAQFFNSSYNLYRSVYGNGRFTSSIGRLRIRVLALVAEKSQQAYGVWILLSSQNVFLLHMILFVSSIESYFQMSALMPQIKASRLKKE